MFARPSFDRRSPSQSTSLGSARSRSTAQARGRWLNRATGSPAPSVFRARDATYRARTGRGLAAIARPKSALAAVDERAVARGEIIGFEHSHRPTRPGENKRRPRLCSRWRPRLAARITVGRPSRGRIRPPRPGNLAELVSLDDPSGSTLDEPHGYPFEVRVRPKRRDSSVLR